MKVSVLIPTLNEENFIGRCLDSVIGGTFPTSDLEILVIDGGSTDRTLEILKDYAATHPFLKVLNNPKKIQSAGLNLGITRAVGEYVVRLDAHSGYASNYIERLLWALEEFGADDVGGCWRIVPRGSGLWDEAVAIALSHPFGIGNARYRLSEFSLSAPTGPEWVDTVPYFCMRRERLAKLGPLNENVGPCEDYELKSRLRDEGGRVLLVPDVEICYFARTDPWNFLKHNFRNGLWAIKSSSGSVNSTVSQRHLVPAVFMAALLLGATGGMIYKIVFKCWILLLGIYFSVAVIVAFDVARRRKDFHYLCWLPLVFLMLHMSYGAGSLKALWDRLKNKGC